MPFFTWFDPMYFIILAPGLIISIYATIKVRGTFARFGKVPNSKGLSGAEAAGILLLRSGVTNVRIEPSQGGALSDHYDPTKRVLRLSPEVYGGRSISSVAVAAHEAGHALQHSTQYAPLMLRSAAVPIVNFGSSLSWILMFAGMALSWTAGGAEGGRFAPFIPYLLWGGVLGFGAVVLFQIVTLPVEFNASARARDRLLALGIVSPSEEKEVGKVLSAAAMTYVAAALTALLTLLYYLIRLGLLGGRRSN
jgi:Zn-dependent membrane protease YugP